MARANNSRNVDLTPIKTRLYSRDIQEYDSEPLTPELSSAASSVPSSAFSRPSRQASWGIDAEDSMEDPRSIKLLRGDSSHPPQLDIYNLLERLHIPNVPRPQRQLTNKNETQLLEKIGQGAHADVYRACLNGTEVAAKVANSKSSERFIRRELEVLDYISRMTDDLDHIIEHYHGKQIADKATVYLELGKCDLMEHLKKESRALISGVGPILGESKWRETASDIVASVATLQRAGIVHGDIKPQNIVWTSKETLKLIDFESAFTPDDSALAKNKDCGDDVIGSSVYCSPELLRMSNDGPSFVSDIFALGVTLLVLATGEEPYSRARSGIEVIVQCQAGDPIRYSTRKDRLTPAIEQIVRGCCSKDPSMRWDIERVVEAVASMEVASRSS